MWPFSNLVVLFLIFIYQISQVTLTAWLSSDDMSQFATALNLCCAMDSFLALLGIVSEVRKGMYVVKAYTYNREKYNVVHKHTRTRNNP